MTDHSGSGLFGPITDVDRRRWQIRAHAVLATVLHNANAAGLVPLVWRVGVGQLYGEVATLGLTGPQIRAIYTTWADFLDLPNRREHTSSEGVHLTAFGEVPERGYRLGQLVGITAHIYPDDDTDPTTEER
ncbi:hypothetical protein AB0L41_31795 [Amycolatopsis mediterranei]|uniref:hypothetical protein n=1 Tax=Amycolatopsis mediterranei TaxID=33910 RepID=UPI00343A6690